jgi:hypothetical protein
LTGSVEAGVQFDLNEADHVTAGDGISGLVLNQDVATLDVYVNGQLLVSGSLAEVSADPPTRDYQVNSADSLIFGFNLELDDVVQVISRPS